MRMSLSLDKNQCCGAEDYYALLGVSQHANALDISLKHHPDKKLDLESKKIFVKFATAFEVSRDVLVFLFVVSFAFQYLNKWEGIMGRKLQEELSNELDLQIKERENGQCGNFSVFESFSYHALSSRFHITKQFNFKDFLLSFCRDHVFKSYVSFQLLVWYSSWVGRYKVKKAPFYGKMLHI